MHMNVLSTSIYVHCIHAWCLKRVSELLKLKFQTVVSFCVGDGNWVLCKSSQCS